MVRSSLGPPPWMPKVGPKVRLPPPASLRPLVRAYFPQQISPLTSCSSFQPWSSGVGELGRNESHMQMVFQGLARSLRPPSQKGHLLRARLATRYHSASPSPFFAPVFITFLSLGLFAAHHYRKALLVTTTGSTAISGSEPAALCPDAPRLLELSLRLPFRDKRIIPSSYLGLAAAFFLCSIDHHKLFARTPSLRVPRPLLVPYATRLAT